MNNIVSVGIYTLAVVGFILWVWIKTRSMNSGQVSHDGSTNRTARGGNDDLTEISGIGKVISGKLCQLGYTRFEQIAGFTKQDIARVNEQLNFKGRIEREKWVSQAKKLARKKR